MPAREGRRIDWSNIADKPIVAAGKTMAATARRSAACDDLNAAFIESIVASPWVLQWRAERSAHESESTFDPRLGAYLSVGIYPSHAVEPDTSRPWSLRHTPVREGLMRGSPSISSNFDSKWNGIVGLGSQG